MSNTPSVQELVERAMARHFSGNPMPHMSGDDRNRLSHNQRRILSRMAEAAIKVIGESKQ